MGVLDYSSTPASNTAINSIGIEGTSPISNFDNAMRQLMADIAAGIVAGSFTANGYVTKAAGYTVATSDRGKIIDCTAALELDLPAAATAGAGFMFIVKANGGAVTVDPNSTENINGASTSLTVSNGTSAIIACTGTAWHSVLLGAVAASATVAGIVELATDAEAQTGTDTARAITPANLQAVTATESRKGVLELATDAEAQTGTDTERAITAANLQAVTATATRKGVVELATAAEVTTGTDTARVPSVSTMGDHQGMAKAWVRFNGTGTPAVVNGFNVASITDNGTGDYTLTFTNALANANYCIAGAGRGASGDPCTVGIHPTVDPTTAAVRIITASDGGVVDDFSIVTVVIFGD